MARGDCRNTLGCPLEAICLMAAALDGKVVLNQGKHSCGTLTHSPVHESQVRAQLQPPESSPEMLGPTSPKPGRFSVQLQSGRSARP